MSKNGLTCAPASTAAQALRSSCRVSGPKLENSNKAPGFITRRHSANSSVKFSHHWIHKLEYSTSKHALCTGSFWASAQIVCSGLRHLANLDCCARACCSMASARSMAITCAFGYRFCSSNAPRPGPAPISAIKPGGALIKLSRSCSRASTSCWSAAALS